MEKPFKIQFAGSSGATVVKLTDSSELASALPAIGLKLASQRVLVLIGGASKMSPQNYQQLQQLFVKVLAPLAEKWQACVVDGGTDAGVMRLIGEARAAIAGKFPLIGVSPMGLVTLPGHSASAEEAAPLECHHTHFLLVPGNRWGDESPWLAGVATELAVQSSSVTILVNGGEVTWRDARQNVQAGRTVIAIAGSGRTADMIAAGLRGEATDERARLLIASGLVQAVDLTADAKTLTSIIEGIFAR
jgi:SLOG in TRPM, prokaryote